MATKIAKISYRYADLNLGEQFYLPNDNTLYTCGASGAWYSPHHSTPIGENTKILPVAPRPVAARRAAKIREVCKRFDITRAELSGYYRNLVASTARPYSGRLPVPRPELPGELRALEALRTMDLVHWVTITDPTTLERRSFEIVSGDWNRLYL